MFLALLVLKPTTLELLKSFIRLSLWREALRRFFSWVWLALAVLLLRITGFWIFFTHLAGTEYLSWRLHTM